MAAFSERVHMLSEGKQDKERERKGKSCCYLFEGGLHAKTPCKKEEEEEGFDK